jgi:hypothetical protein
MAITKSVGTGVDVASTYGTAVVMSAITNATEAVATLAGGHGVIVGDYLEIASSGWQKLALRIARAKAVSTNDVTLELINTTNVSDFPTGTGAGTIRRITGWTNISQRTPNFQVSGGEVQFADISDLNDAEERKLPVRRTATDLTLPGYYDLSLPWVATVSAASESSIPTGLRVRYPNGNKLVANAYWSFSNVATIEDFTLRDSIALTFAARQVAYAT